MSFVPQLQDSCWKDEQEQLLEKETGDEQIVDEQSDKAGKYSGFDFMAARNKTPHTHRRRKCHKQRNWKQNLEKRHR